MLNRYGRILESSVEFTTSCREQVESFAVIYLRSVGDALVADLSAKIYHKCFSNCERKFNDI